MPTTLLERLLFAQGGKCFFCEEELLRGEASVEHLVASANGGSNSDDNCVACCKAINALFGSISLKEKFRVVLNQRGSFRCPNGATRLSVPSPAKVVRPKAPDPKSRFARVVANLASSKSNKPRTPQALRNHIRTLFPGAPLAEIESLVVELKTAGKLSEEGTTVTYAL